jgi:hypothetical protein
MKRRARVLVPLLVAWLLVPSIATAQTRLFFGAGATLPNGDYGEYANTGWMLNAGLGFPLKNPKLGVNIAGWYGGNSHSDFEGDETTLYGAFGHLTYRFHEPQKAGLFAGAGAGFLAHSYSSAQFPDEEGTDTGFAYNLLAGLDIPLKARTFTCSRAGLAGDDTMLRLKAGLSIPLGGN